MKSMKYGIEHALKAPCLLVNKISGSVILVEYVSGGMFEGTVVFVCKDENLVLGKGLSGSLDNYNPFYGTVSLQG